MDNTPLPTAPTSVGKRKRASGERYKAPPPPEATALIRPGIKRRKTDTIYTRPLLRAVQPDDGRTSLNGANRQRIKGTRAVTQGSKAAPTKPRTGPTVGIHSTTKGRKSS